MSAPPGTLAGMSRYTATATIAAALLLALTACGTEKPGERVVATVETAPTPVQPAVLDTEAALEDCIDAVAELASDADGHVPSEPKPEECTHMDDSDYAEAYMKGIHENQVDTLEERERDREEAETDDPTP
jgi:hypothetical protein